MCIRDRVVLRIRRVGSIARIFIVVNGHLRVAAVQHESREIRARVAERAGAIVAHRLTRARIVHREIEVERTDGLRSPSGKSVELLRRTPLRYLACHPDTSARRRRAAHIVYAISADVVAIARAPILEEAEKPAHVGRAAVLEAIVELSARTISFAIIGVVTLVEFHRDRMAVVDRPSELHVVDDSIVLVVGAAEEGAELLLIAKATAVRHAPLALAMIE